MSSDRLRMGTGADYFGGSSGWFSAGARPSAVTVPGDHGSPAEDRLNAIGMNTRALSASSANAAHTAMAAQMAVQAAHDRQAAASAMRRSPDVSPATGQSVENWPSHDLFGSSEYTTHAAGALAASALAATEYSSPMHAHHRCSHQANPSPLSPLALPKRCYCQTSGRQ